MNTTYKTIDQIEAETTRKQYYRPFDYARSVALVTFLRQLEAQHGDRFKLLTASPHITHDRGAEQETKQFTLGLWARWKVDNTAYYLQMNDNPFFNAYITRSWNIDSKTRRSEYAVSMNDIMYANVRWDATPETIEQVIANLHAAYDVSRSRNIECYQKDIPAYERQEKQTIYNH